VENRFDVIVVGGGPAGLTSAYVLAKSGFNVMVLERGNQCGVKNVSGGILYGDSFQEVFGEVYAGAPFERSIKKKTLGCIAGNSVTSFTYDNGVQDGSLGHSLLRVGFDKWLSEKTAAAGAEILCGVTVDTILFDNNVARGISAGNDKIYADVVVLAEGANAVLTEKIGFRQALKPYQVGVSVKEVIGLSEQVINDRFSVDSPEGAAIELFGTFTEEIDGGAFIYTNRDSISLGLVFALSSYKEKNNPPYELLERFKDIPYIGNLIRGGETIEYSAHLLPETGVEMMPKLYGNGILIAGDAAGFVLKNGRTIEGMNYAFESGKLAAETIIEAVQFNNYSADALSGYANKINNNRLFKRLNKFRNSYQFFQNPRLYKEYPELVNKFSKMLFSDGNSAEKKISGLLLKALQSSDVTLKDLFSVMITTQRTL
jgi:electron transfer flavoprotein-quinone oxidoreductase